MEVADLTGFPMTQCQPLSGIRLRSTPLDASDWSGSWVEGSRFEHCSFEMADLSEVRDHGNEFIRCAFRNTMFVGAVLGFKGTRFTKCLFEGADFTRTGFIRAVFVDCAFVNCKLKRVDFGASRFTRTRFEGTLRDVWFRGDHAVPEDRARLGPPEGVPVLDVDLSRARLEGVTYGMGLDLSRVTLPNQQLAYLFDRWAERLEAVRRGIAASDEQTRKEAEIFLYAYQPRGNQDWWIVTLSDLDRDFGPSLSRMLLELLGTPVRTSRASPA